MSQHLDTRLDAVRRVLRGHSTAEQEAQALGVEPAAVEAWAAFMLEGMRAESTRRRGRVARPAVAVAVVLLGVLLVRPVFAQVTCTQTLPFPLVTLCPDEPARAADVNGNFAALAAAALRTGPLDGGARITTPGLVVATAANSTVSSVTTDRTAVLEARDGAGQPRLELRGNGTTPYIDFGNDVVSDFNARIILNGAGELELSAPTIRLSSANVIEGCRANFTAVTNGRLCVGPLETAATGHAAILDCRTRAAHVCTHNELQQACSVSGFLPGATQGWFGDATGDDALLIWNSNTCAGNGGNNSGPPQSALGPNTLPYRCCY